MRSVLLADGHTNETNRGLGGRGKVFFLPTDHGDTAVAFGTGAVPRCRPARPNDRPKAEMRVAENRLGL